MRRFVAYQSRGVTPSLSLVVVPRIFPNTNLDSMLLSTAMIQAEFELIIVVGSPSQVVNFDQYLIRVLKSCPKMVKATIIQLQCDLGLATGRNIGAAVACSEYLIFADDDVLLVSDVSPLVSYLVNGKYRGVQPLLMRMDDETIDSAGDEIAEKRHGIYDARPRYANTNIRKVLDHLTVQEVPSLRGAFMVISKTALISLGGFDDSFNFNYDDVDLGWRMTVAGYKLLFVPHIRVVHKGGRTTDARLVSRRLRKLSILNIVPVNLKVIPIRSWSGILTYLFVKLSLFEYTTIKYKELTSTEILKDIAETVRMLISRMLFIRYHRRKLKNLTLQGIGSLAEWVKE